MSAENAACEDDLSNNRHAGNFRNNTGWVSYGTKATVNPATTTFVPCIGSGGPLSVDGPAAWVAVTAASGDFNSIIQIGIINCNAPLVGVCDGTGPHYFYADGGCGLPVNVPTAEDLGTANMDPHVYRVEHVLTSALTGRWDFYVDNSRKRFLYDTDSAINCWITHDRDSQWYGETWDGGDGYADDGDRLNFTLAKYKSDNGSTWSGPGWTPYPTPCNHSAENSVGLDYKCKRPSGSDKFDIWSLAW